MILLQAARAAKLPKIVQKSRCPDLSDDWGLLNQPTGGSHDRGESNPAAPADDRRHAHPWDGREGAEVPHPGDQGLRGLSWAATRHGDTGRSARVSAAHDRQRGDPVDVQRADRGAAVLLQHDLRARGDEALHAIPHRTAQAARGFQRRGGVRHPDGSTRTGAEVSGRAQHLLRRRTSGVRGLQPKDQRYRQRPDADPCRVGQGSEGP